MKKGCIDMISTKEAPMFCQIAGMLGNIAVGQYMGLLNPGHYLSAPVNAFKS